MPSTSSKIIVILPDIRSAYNVGSIFRTADAVGVDELYLVGYTPKPIDRFGRARKDIAKSALGAEQTVLWRYFETLDDALITLHQEGYYVVAVEQDRKSMPYTTLPQKEKIAFVFGNEVTGLSKDIMTKCDCIIEIPMRGSKESLNVGVSVGVILFSYKH